MNKFIIGIIPARGGSKGIKDKNIIELSGKPLIAYTIEAAFTSRMLSDFIVSTDSERIAEISMKFGANAPFLRPEKLSGDKSSSIDVIKHSVAWYENEKKRRIDDIILLQPTSPLRTSDDIDSSLAIFHEMREFDSLISCYDASSYHPRIMYKMNGIKMVPFLGQTTNIRRQDFEKVYIRNGAIYISTRKLVMEEGRIIGDSPLGYIMPKERSLNIDEPHDLELAEFYINRRKSNS